MRTWSAAVVAAVAGLLLAAPASLAAASDLGSLLAPAPGLGWIEATTTNPNVIEGPFTARSYGDFVDTSSGTPGTTTSALESYGFNGGYGKEWVQSGSKDLLVERVFQFNADSGATSWYQDIKSGTEGETGNQGIVAGASAIPDSFSAILKDPAFPKQWRVDFRKSNLVFVVHTDSNTHDLGSLAVSQAQTEYRSAPASTVHLAPKPPLPSWLLVVTFAASLLVIVLGIGVVVLVMARAGRRQAALEGAAYYVHLSPDGAYWWDGASWRDANTEVPPFAQRSPDGLYWWDGRRWRLAGS